MNDTEVAGTPVVVEDKVEKEEVEHEVKEEEVKEEEIKEDQTEKEKEKEEKPSSEVKQYTGDRKICIITGANTGIGKETAKGMLQKGYYVIFACRSMQRGSEAEKDVLTLLNAKDEEISRVMELELSDFDSIKAFATQFKENFSHLHVLILNAGLTTNTLEHTKQGHETMFGVNHLGHFLLTNLLLDVMRNTPSSRIVVLASAAHKFPGPLTDMKQLTECPPFSSPATAIVNYGRSKLCNMLFTFELAKKLKEESEKEGTPLITVNAVHPGAVNTDLTRNAPWYLAWLIKPMVSLFFKTAESGAKTSLYVALSEDLASVTGKYFADEKEATPEPYAVDADTAAALWKLSEELTGVTWPQKE